jgi:hypothetical protein
MAKGKTRKRLTIEWPKKKREKDKQYNGQRKKDKRTNNIMAKEKTRKGQTI